ncbi:MAG: DNA polymerase IV [Clostridia bacterium]|jgi:DNA polymerase-4|nr:DNA polymerase IV [Clostridia bacterium]MCI9290901.1 DNA polymerase IV [Clostridia bacterium]
MRKILHCDANNFYASIECMLDPTLKDKYVAVSGNPDKRHGIILAKNQKAKECGVKTGDVIWEAKRKCPNLVLVPPQFDKYVYYSNKIFDIYCQYTDRVEPFGIDECWLDVTGSMRLFKSATAIADELRERIKKEIGITISVGVSFNKIFAKLGSDMKKPDATTLISPDNFKSKVWPLDVSDLLMIGRKTEAKLKGLGINTIGDLANTNVDVLISKFGINGQKIYDNANGNNSEEVRLYYDKHIPKSIGNSTTMPKDVVLRDEAKAVIMALSEMVAIRLRKYGFIAGGVHLGMRFNDLSYVGKQSKLPYKINSASSICDFAMEIYDSFQHTLPLRLLSVTTFDLSKGEEMQQLSLFDDERVEKLRRIDASLDKIREKYGYNALKSASLLEYPFVTDGLEDSDFLPFKK